MNEEHSSILELEVTRSSGILVSIYQTKQWYIPEDMNLHNHSYGNLKFHVTYLTWGPHSGEDEEYCLLGCNAVQSGNSLNGVTFQKIEFLTWYFLSPVVASSGLWCFFFPVTRFPSPNQWYNAQDSHSRNYYYLRDGPVHWDLKIREVKAISLKQCTLIFWELWSILGGSGYGHTLNSSNFRFLILKHWLRTTVTNAGHASNLPTGNISNLQCRFYNMEVCMCELAVFICDGAGNELCL
jgi:hypothetical protein